MGDYGAPVKVPPLIKGGRWICLILGYYYGRVKLAAFSRMAESHRTRKEMLRKQREKEAAEIKRKKAALKKQNAKCGCN